MPEGWIKQPQRVSLQSGVKHKTYAPSGSQEKKEEKKEKKKEEEGRCGGGDEQKEAQKEVQKDAKGEESDNAETQQERSDSGQSGDVTSEQSDDSGSSCTHHNSKIFFRGVEYSHPLQLTACMLSEVFPEGVDFHTFAALPTTLSQVLVVTSPDFPNQQLAVKFALLDKRGESNEIRIFGKLQQHPHPCVITCLRSAVFKDVGLYAVVMPFHRNIEPTTKQQKRAFSGMCCHISEADVLCGVFGRFAG